jgi:hypothetical protein
MFGLMFIEIDSFDELKQSSGYGVVLQKDFNEDIFACSVFVEESEKLKAKVFEWKIVKRRRKSLKAKLAMNNYRKKRKLLKCIHMFHCLFIYT